MPKKNTKLTSPMEDYSRYLRDRMRAVVADRDLTRSARNAALKDLCDAAVQFIHIYQLMSIQSDNNKQHRPATPEEIRERVASCVDGVTIERFVADMNDCGVDKEQAWDAAYFSCYGDPEFWGMTYPEAIRAAGSLGIPYAPMLARD